MPLNFAVKLAATIAVEALQVGLQASQRTKGPRLDELKLTTAEYGTPLPRFLGARRFTCSVIHAEDLKEVEQTSKVKGGGKQTSYHYLATFAAAIADNEIEKVLKIWFDDKLVYDATGSGPISYASSLGIDLDKVMRTYLGTEDQLPDPRYSAWCEDRYGPDSAPAYRGLAYLFFEELPVDNFGNRIPQIDVLAVSAQAPSYPWQLVTGLTELTGIALSPDGSRMYLAHGTGFNVVDIPTRTLIITSTLPHSISAPYALTPDGIYALNVLGSKIYLIGLDGEGGEEVTATFASTGWSGCAYAGGQVLLFPSSFTGNAVGVFSGSTVSSIATNHKPSHFFTNAAGNAIGVGTTSGNILSIGPALTAATLIDTTSYGTSGAAYGFDNGTNYVVWQDDNIFLIDKVSYAVVGHVVTASPTPGGLYESFSALPPGISTFRVGVDEYDSATLALLQSDDKSDWPVALPSGTFEVTTDIYEPVNHALVSPYNGSSSGLVIRALDRATSAGTTLGAIVSKMCDAAALADRDTSLLTQPVAGYSWTRGDVKSQMEPVLDIHDVDARPHDFEIEFLPRGSAPSGTLLTADFAKSGEESPRYKDTVTQDTDLPVLLRVNFADTGFDQQTNNVLSPLPADSVDSQRDDTIDLTTYAATPTEAQQLADRYMRRQWNSREKIENSLTAMSLAMEPGDVNTISLDGMARNARLVKQTIAAGRIDCSFVRDETSFAVLNTDTTGPVMDGRDQETIQIPSPIRGFVVDAPLRDDSEDDVRPLLYAGAGAYASLSYPGAVIYEATGSGTSLAYDQLFAAITAGATWGLCSDTLSAVSSPWLWDRGNALTISLQNGSLTSVAEADIDADPSLNLILVGRTGAWEYVNFTTAALNGDGTYTLSGFKRGRRGTEWACGTHSSSETIILASSLEVEEMGTDDVGADLSFKAQSIGRPISAAAAIDVAPYTGATLKPYAPASVQWWYDGTDLQGTIFRRTRLGGTWNGSTIPLGEAAEEYEVDVYHGSTLKWTISVSGTNAFTYTAAMAAADGNTLPTPPPIEAYQISATVGRGFALAA